MTNHSTKALRANTNKTQLQFVLPAQYHINTFSQIRITFHKSQALEDYNLMIIIEKGKERKIWSWFNQKKIKMIEKNLRSIK